GSARRTYLLTAPAPKKRTEPARRAVRRRGRVRRAVVQPLKILSLSAEVAPFAKAGGLADVCGSLPKALAALGHEVRVVLPAYQPTEAAPQNGKHGVRQHPATLQVPMGTGLVPAGVLEATLPNSEVPVYFIAERHRFGDRPFFYGYSDDAYR